MPSMGESSAPTSRNGREALDLASLSSSVFLKEALLGMRSEEKDTMRAVGPSHRTPLTMSLCAPAQTISPYTVGSVCGTPTRSGWALAAVKLVSPANLTLASIRGAR